jgi:hypothetical protein
MGGITSTSGGHSAVQEGTAVAEIKSILRRVDRRRHPVPTETEAARLEFLRAELHNIRRGRSY